MSAIARPIIRALTLLLVAATLAVGLAGPASAAGKVSSVADAGELEGTITTTDGLDFTGTLTAYWWSDDNEFIFWDSVSFDGATSGATYSFTDVAPGDYYVEYLDESDTYASGIRQRSQRAGRRARRSGHGARDRRSRKDRERDPGSPAGQAAGDGERRGAPTGRPWPTSPSRRSGTSASTTPPRPG